MQVLNTDTKFDKILEQQKEINMEKYTLSKNKKMIISALLLALFIILDRLITINTQFIAINLSLVPIMLAGMILGWKYALLIGALRRLNRSNIMAIWSIFPRFYNKCADCQD